jgi:hypothetical protein
MDLLSRIAGWLGENEATISAVVGIAALRRIGKRLAATAVKHGIRCVALMA